LTAAATPKRDPRAVLPPELAGKAREFAEVVVGAADTVAARHADDTERRAVADEVRDAIVCEVLNRLRFQWFARDKRSSPVEN